MRDSASKLFFFEKSNTEKKSAYKTIPLLTVFDYRKPVLNDTLPYSSLDKIE